MSDRYGSFDTHIGILYDILCHMAYVTNFHKMAFYEVRQIDLCGSEPFESKKKETKNAKNGKVNFSFVFLGKFLCKKESHFEHDSSVDFEFSVFSGVQISTCAP